MYKILELTDVGLTRMLEHYRGYENACLALFSHEKFTKNCIIM